ncbi:MAG: excinuclease ABC subunit UvrC [Candidatus Saccharimonadales bacterium]
MNEQLEAKLKTLPRSPGVYFHKDARGEVIYVGKAAVLRNRVRQYFQDSRDKDIKTQALVAEIDDTDWIEVESEIDALFLESEMVKRYMPRYNILLRDDKSQTFVRIDMKSEWPTVSFTRNPADDGADYYGPFYNSYALKKALRYLRKVFPYYTREPKPGQSRLDEDLGLSPKRDDGSEVYKANLRKLVSYIKGNRVQLANEIERDMKTAAGLHEFERAASLRNKLGHMRELQRRVMFGDREFLDISKDKALRDIATLFKLDKLPARIEGYDVSHMGGTNVVASMVVFTNGVSDRAAYRKFKAKLQQNDDYANMHETLLRRFSPKNVQSWGMPSLVLIDGGKGQLEVAIKALEEREITCPIISIAKREEEIIVHVTRSHIDTAHLTALAQNPSEDVAVTRSGEFYIVNLHPGQRNAGSHSKNLRASSKTYQYIDIVKLFQRIRDESHRFAISYHTVLKRQKQTESVLEDIPGIGPATRKKLIKTFGSVRGVKEADRIQIVEAIGEAKTVRLLAYL